MQKMVERLPLSALLLETDSPALPAVKGERNVPANVAVSARLIARIKGVSVEEVAAATARNARTLFSGLPRC